MSTLLDWTLTDFRSSAVPDNLTLANVATVEGDRAIETLAGPSLDKLGGHSQQYVTAPVQRILDRYQFAAAGLWVAYGATLDGIGGAVAYTKPMTPRHDPHKLGKVIKYETPAKETASPILPIVPDDYAAAIYARYGVEAQPGEAFWQVLKRWPHIPVAIVEGFKKALALIAQGIPAIAIRGITQWHLKGALDLHPELGTFAVEGRQTLVIFDQDEKTSTQAAVFKEARKLGNALERQGCKVRMPLWGSTEGKGIDDCLYALGDGAGEWLQTTLDNAPTLREYSRGARLAAALGAIARYNRLSFPIERETQGEYLPELPTLTPGAIHIVDAGMGSGKTHRIGRDWVQVEISAGNHVLVLSPLNSLGQQTAKDWGIAHIHDAGTSGGQQRQFWEALQNRPAVAMCPDSIQKLPRWFWSKPVLLVIDEGNQTTAHITKGDTFGSRYAPLVEAVASAAQHAINSGGAIVLSEDGIPDRCVKFWQSISGAESVRCFTHKRTATPWQVSAYSGAVSGYRYRLLWAIERGDLILFVTSSQRESKRLAYIAESMGISVHRIDSETNEGGAYSGFFRSPDQWLKDNSPQLLILSPSAKTGVSIEGNVPVESAYFDSVWGYFPSLDTDTHAQLLGRYRPAVPRHIYCPPFINPGADEELYSVQAIKKRQRTNLATIAKLFDVGTLDDSQTTIEAAISEYLAESAAIAGSQKSIAAEALAARLEAAGHCVKDVEVGSSTAKTLLWKETQDAIWDEEAGEIADIALDETHTPDWAYRTLDSHEAGRELRLTARKVLWREEFPGVLFDDSDECYQALCLDYGAMVRGVRLQARAENLDAAKDGDRDAVEAVLGGNIRSAHRLPRNYIRAGIINHLGLLAMLDGQSWSNKDKRCQSIKRKALKYRGEIKYWLRLNIDEEQTPVEVVNKLLRKLGIKAIAISRPGRRCDKRDKIYTAQESLNNPVRVRLLKALRGKLSGAVSPICNKGIDPLQIEDTNPKTPIPIGIGALVRCLKTGVIALVEAIDGAIATLGDETGRIWQAPVAELTAA
jgi:hypothetical protein